MVQKEDLAQVARGFLMGGADIVPGVSGGTMALILGIYQRLVGAVSHFDIELVRLLCQAKWRAAAEHVDLRFLVCLGAGILTGIACLARLMRHLLTEERTYTLAVFFGLILASSIIVARMVQPNSRSHAVRCLVLAVAAALLAFWITSLNQFAGQESLLYFFACGMVAICAMILPGISGAYVLWLLGAYVAVTGVIERVTHFAATGHDWATLLVFATGCAIGIVAFSKLLRRLLASAHAATMAVLGGFMLGSLRGVWPFQRDLTPDVEKLKLKRFETFVPAEWSTEVIYCVVLATAALVFVLALDRWGAAAEKHEIPV